MREKLREKLRYASERTQMFLSRSPKMARGLELMLFHAVMWGIVLCSFIGILRRAGLKRPSFLPGSIFSSLDSVPFHYLVIAAAIAASLALIMPTLLSRVAEISYGGIKVALAQSESGLNSLESALDVPEEPIIEGRLKGPQLYHYERLSHNLYRILEQRKDPNSLDFISRKKYRRLIDYVARAACLINHKTKFLAIALQLETFKDRRLTWDEQYLIGLAYLVAADECGKSDRQNYFKSAAGYFEAARRSNSYNVTITFNLGVTALSLGNYPKGIRLMKQCISMDQTYFQAAKWNIACGYAKLDQGWKSLETLEEIEAGPIWEQNQDDEWFNTGNPNLEKAFKLLCAVRITENKLKDFPGQESGAAVANELNERIATIVKTT
jgi:hypothetical protein